MRPPEPPRRKRLHLTLLASAIAALVAVACSAAAPPADATSTATATAPPTAVPPTVAATPAPSATADTNAAGQAPAPTATTARSPAPTATSGPATPRPAPVQARNRIAVGGVDGSIFTINPDGTDRVLLLPVPISRTGERGSREWPVWSPDGTRIAFSEIVQGATGPDVSLGVIEYGNDTPPTTVYVDLRGTAGIGFGVAHFTTWSPDGAYLGVIAGGPQNLVTFTVAVDGSASRQVASGAPVYLTWAPDGSGLLVHIGPILRAFDIDAATGLPHRPRDIGDGSLRYLTPQYHPGGSTFLWADDDGDETHVILSGDPLTSSVRQFTGSNTVAFRWSPDGRHIAIVDGAPRLYSRLSVLFTADGRPEPVNTIEDNGIVSFWWSPDSRKIAFSKLLVGTGAFNWSVLDIATGEVTHIGDFVPSPDSSFIHSFFDQFSESIQLWSPDSTQLVLAGFRAGGDNGSILISNPTQQATAPEIWVIDATGARGDPLSIGNGNHATWSPQ